MNYLFALTLNDDLEASQIHTPKVRRVHVENLVVVLVDVLGVVPDLLQHCHVAVGWRVLVHVRSQAGLVIFRGATVTHDSTP